MIERDLLLNAAVAMLLATLAWHHPALQQRFGRGGLACVLVGTLLPFVDLAIDHAVTADRIELLTRAPLLRAPLWAALALAATGLLATALVPTRRAVRLMLGLGAGYALHALLALLTPVGWPLAAPWDAAPFMLPILPGGHLLLLTALLPTLALGEALPRVRRWVVLAAGSLAALYLLAGILQFGVVSVRARELALDGASVRVYPDGDWLANWRIVRATPDQYNLRRVPALVAELPDGDIQSRWNDEALLLSLLGDPVVNRFYYRVFRNPVVRLEISGAHITLLMQELADIIPPVPGPTLYVESDLSGRNRFYQLQRFN